MRPFLRDRAKVVLAVIAAADKFQLLGKVALGDKSHATPAIADGVMYIRTKSALFSLGK